MITSYVFFSAKGQPLTPGQPMPVQKTLNDVFVCVCVCHAMAMATAFWNAHEKNPVTPFCKYRIVKTSNMKIGKACHSKCEQKEPFTYGLKWLKVILYLIKSSSMSAKSFGFFNSSRRTSWPRPWRKASTFEESSWLYFTCKIHQVKTSRGVIITGTILASFLLSGLHSNWKRKWDILQYFAGKAVTFRINSRSIARNLSEGFRCIGWPRLITKGMCSGQWQQTSENPLWITTLSAAWTTSLSFTTFTNGGHDSAKGLGPWSFNAAAKTSSPHMSEPENSGALLLKVNKQGDIRWESVVF